MKNIALFLPSFILLAACQSKGVPGAVPTPVFSTQAATAKECPQGGVDVEYEKVVYTICNGVQGATGKSGNVGATGATGATGPAGQNGYGLVFTTVAATGTQCPTGGYVFLEAYDDEESGTWSCYDSGQNSVTICNGTVGATGDAGQNGTNGIDGSNAPQSSFATVGVIEPCGPNSSAYKEVLLCLADGSILADFSDSSSGNETRLAFIPAGSYADTDDSGCDFTVAADQGGGLTVTWAAQHGNTAGSADCAPTAVD